MNTQILTTVLRSLPRFFERSSESGTFTIENEILTGNSQVFLVGSYVALTGSILNNGIYLVTDNLITIPEAKDETFTGEIYQLAIPNDFLAMVEEIQGNIETTAKADQGITSFSFGGYSESRATTADGVVASWREVYKSRLVPYRSGMFTDIKI